MSTATRTARLVNAYVLHRDATLWGGSFLSLGSCCGTPEAAMAVARTLDTRYGANSTVVGIAAVDVVTGEVFAQSL